MCDLLGLDPLAIAKGGKVVIFCRAVAANRVNGRVGWVIGGERIVDVPMGQDLPRIR